MSVFRNGQNENKGTKYVLPFLPAEVLASHHFPDLSMMSKCSPFLSGSSLGSSAAPGSIFQFSTTEQRPRKIIKEQKTHSQTAPQLAIELLVLQVIEVRQGL